MRRAFVWLLVLVIGLVTPAAQAETWNPSSAQSANVPTPVGSGPFYQYAPSIVQVSPTERIVYYCANRVGGLVWDHIGVNHGTKQTDGSYRWGPTSFALDPQGPNVPRWASRHICDPDVVRGTFTRQGHTYGWAMFFTAFPDLDRYPAERPINVVGVAYADSPDGPWTFAPNALLDESTEGPLSDWGVGQPSAISSDGQGKVRIFYSGIGNIVQREIDLANADNPLLGNRRQVPVDGLTTEPDGSIFLHNASFAYDQDNDQYLISRDTGPFNDRVQERTEVDRIPGSSLRADQGTWTVLSQISQCHSGFRYNHNSGIVRDPHGNIADAIHVYFATEPPGGGFWSYRLWEAKAPLAYVSDQRPALTNQADGRLMIVGHTTNRCEANAWTSTEYGPWQRLGASPTGRPVAAQQQDGSAALFARAADSTIWWNQNLTGWTQLPNSSAAEDPVVSRLPDGRLVVAIRRNDPPGSRVYLNAQQTPNGQFATAWQDLGPSPAGTPVFGTNEDGSLVIFARADQANGGQIWFNQQAQPDTWSGWRPLNSTGAFDGGPTVARQQDGRLVVAASRTEGGNQVVHLTKQTAKNMPTYDQTWTSQGPSPAHDPLLVEQANGRLAMLARAADGTIWWQRQDAQNAPFTGWANLGGQAGSDPVAIKRQDQRLDLVIRQTDGTIAHRRQTEPGGSSFGAWTVIP